MKIFFSLILMASVLFLASCSKSDDPSSGANTGQCVLTGITSGGSTPLSCFITYNSSNIVNVNCSNAGRTTDTKRNYDYTYGINTVSIKATTTDAYGTSSKTYDIVLQNQLPFQLNINGQLSQKFFYNNSRLLYYRTYRNNIDSAVFLYDAKGENIVSSSRYTKSGNSSWGSLSETKYSFDTNTNPLKAIFLIEETFGDDNLRGEYFNKNNIITRNNTQISYVYNGDNLPTQVSQPGSQTIFYSYKCP